MKTSVFLAFALNISFLTPLFAQTPPQRPAQLNPPVQDEIVRVTTNLVQVDAVVTDNNGNGEHHYIAYPRGARLATYVCRNPQNDSPKNIKKGRAMWLSLRSVLVSN